MWGGFGCITGLFSFNFSFDLGLTAHLAEIRVDGSRFYWGIVTASTWFLGCAPASAHNETEHHSHGA
jgi:hypothetical protein